MNKADELIKMATAALLGPEGGGMSHQTAISVLSMVAWDKDNADPRVAIDRAHAESSDG